MQNVPLTSHNTLKVLNETDTQLPLFKKHGFAHSNGMGEITTD